MKNLTVLYYSANRENKKFESHICENLLKNKGRLPLVSVTQKLMPEMGQNICVGRRYHCYGNEFRQIQIGLKMVKTKYVIVAESDVLYPPEYFHFQPTDADFYHYANVWAVYVRGKSARRAFFKKYSDGAQIVKRDVFLNLITKAIGEGAFFTKDNDMKSRIYKMVVIPEDTWTSENPVITFKTEEALARHTNVIRTVRPVSTLPYFGNISDLGIKMYQ